MGVWEVICETAIKTTSTHTDTRRHAHACTHCVSIHMHTHARVGLLPGGRVWGGSKTAGVRPVWSLWGPLGRARVVRLMCVCVWLLHPAQGPLGVVGCEDPNASGPRVRSQSMAGCPSSPRGRAACLTVPGCLYAVPGRLHGAEGCAVPGWARVAQGPGLWLLATWVGGTQPACSCPTPSCRSPSLPQDLAAEPQERVGTNSADGHRSYPPSFECHPPSFECQPEPGLGHCMRQSPGPGACGHAVHLSISCLCHLSVCVVSCLVSVPVGRPLTRPGVTHSPETLTFLSLPPFSPSLFRSMYHLSLPFSAFIFIFFFLFFLCAPSRGAVTEEKGPATWE